MTPILFRQQCVKTANHTSQNRAGIKWVSWIGNCLYIIVGTSHKWGQNLAAKLELLHWHPIHIQAH